VHGQHLDPKAKTQKISSLPVTQRRKEHATKRREEREREEGREKRGEERRWSRGPNLAVSLNFQVTYIFCFVDAKS
jgi:hypothetical protein